VWDFKDRVAQHLELLRTKCTLVRPVLPNQEVIVFFKGLKPEYAAAVRAVDTVMSLLPVSQQTLEWAATEVKNYLDNAANAEDLEQRTGGLKLQWEGSGNGPSGSKGKKEEVNLSGNCSVRQIKQAMQLDPSLVGKLRPALGVKEQPKQP
jgi:hypothetical protein